MPGRYTVRLTVNGRAYSQPLNIRMDPRVTTPTVALQQQFDLSMQAYNGVMVTNEMMDEVNHANEQLRKLQIAAAGNADRQKSIEALQQKVRELSGGQRQGPGAPAQAAAVDQLPLGRLAGSFSSMLDLLQDADVAPTMQAVRDMAALRVALARGQANWNVLKPQLQAAGVTF